MKPLSEQDHYEVLEVSRSTSQQEIERAYRLARTTYAEDSLAGYSVFGEGDVEAIRERIESAYRVLSNPEWRRAYDAWLAASGAGPELAPAGQPEPRAPSSASAEPVSPLDAFEGFDEESGGYDGPRLRRSRLRRGLELEDVADATKINPAYLRFLEEERFAELPARVYVRGFVMAYASCVGLDPKAVVSSFMQRFDQERSRRQHSFAKRD